MKRYKANPDEQIKEEAKQHSANDKRETTAKKVKIRKSHINTLKRLFPNAKSILCIGCRDDSEVKDFVRAGYNAIGIDVANSSKYITTLDAHKLDTKFNELQFDLIYSSHSLEHMYDPYLAMKQFRRVAKKGIFIVLPKGGMRNGSDPAEPSLNHPSIFDIMTADIINLKDLLKSKSLLEDFQSFGKFEPVYFKSEKRSLEMALKFR